MKMRWTHRKRERMGVCVFEIEEYETEKESSFSKGWTVRLRERGGKQMN